MTDHPQGNIFIKEICSLCDDEIFRPKALPCSHRFCLECLDSYIFQKTTETSLAFTCPKCDNHTRPRRIASGRGYWAEEFPDSNVTVRAVESESEDPICLPCKRKGNSVDAAIWCRNCKVLLCPFCSKFHFGIHRKHKVFDVLEYKRRQSFFRRRSNSKNPAEKSFVCNFQFKRSCSLSRLFPTATIVGGTIGKRFESVDR